VKDNKKKPKCVLSSGVDGNVFAIIGHVVIALRTTGLVDEARTFCDEATNQNSYDDVLKLVHKYVDVE
jgi:hypothetical protein